MALSLFAEMTYCRRFFGSMPKRRSSRQARMRAKSWPSTRSRPWGDLLSEMTPTLHELADEGDAGAHEVGHVLDVVELVRGLVVVDRRRGKASPPSASPPPASFFSERSSSSLMTARGRNRVFWR
jgi:hypothetical protein